MDDAERERLGRELRDFIDNVGGDSKTLEVAQRHAKSESDRRFIDASQKELELRTLRGVVDLCKGELAELTDAANRLYDLLASRPTSGDEADAVAGVRKAMKGLHVRTYLTMLRDSVRKFEALTIMRRMLRKLRVNDDVRSAADDWAKKRLRL